MRGRITFLFNFIPLRPFLSISHFLKHIHTFVVCYMTWNALWISLSLSLSLSKAKTCCICSLSWMKYGIKEIIKPTESSSQPLRLYWDKWPFCRNFSKTHTLEVPMRTVAKCFSLSHFPIEQWTRSSKCKWLNDSHYHKI